MATYTCPACGFRGLDKPPRVEGSGGSFEICPSCGIQFGYSDEMGGDVSSRPSFYRGWGTKWYSDGAKWHDPSPPPDGWDGRRQYADFRKASHDIPER